MKSLVINILSCLMVLGMMDSQLMAQELSQTVRGRVVDASSQLGLKGARVQISYSDTAVSATTDARGAFRLEGIPVGRHTLIVSLDGYDLYFIPDLEVRAGKESVLEIGLHQRLYDLGEVLITAGNSRQLNGISTRTFTVEETQRFAATYYDPARLMTSNAGVTTANDQANHIVVRGNSPNGILWRMEGVDIVNPNHLTNAGTFSDRVSHSGGGTIILSTQLLDNSSFMTGAFAPQYGNALSGVFDIHLRRGNNEQYEFTGQAGLIGIDLAAEGPISKPGGASFLANYRYSTVGLLSLMGVPLGDEEITYQDFAFNLHLPTARAGTFTLFGMGGLSSNVFAAERDSSMWKFQKDRFDINFSSDMGAVGATHSLPLGNKGLWKTVVAASAIKSERTADLLDDSYQPHQAEEDILEQSKISATTSLRYKFGQRASMRAGLFFNQLGYRLRSAAFDTGPSAEEQLIASAQGNTFLLQPYFNFSFYLSQRLKANAGLHGMYLGLNKASAVEPRASLVYEFGPGKSLSLAYGLHSQLQLLGTYFAAITQADGSILFPNRELDFTKAHHLVLSYHQLVGENLHLKVEPYYQQLFQVPVSTNPNSSFSVLNLLEGYVTEALVNEGKGRNYGLEFTLEKVLSDDYYYLISGSLYDSKYTAADGIERNTRFNGNYQFSLTGGKEIHRITRKNKNKTIGINLRFLYQGGFRDTPIDAAASAREQRTVYVDEQAFSLRLQDYYRLDLRLTFKRDKARFTRVFSFDIQNVTNRQNIAFQYYDFLKQQVVTKYQLGIIPLLSYRLEF